MSSVKCQKCGTINAPTAVFCATCGSQLTSPAPAPGWSQPNTPLGGQPTPPLQYGYPPNQNPLATGIDRTKTGLLMISIGFFMSWIPFVGIVGGIIELVGALMVILGRKAFGRIHDRNVIWSIIIWFVSGGVIAVAIFSAIFSAIANFRFNSTSGTPQPTNFASAFAALNVVFVIAPAIYGISYVLFTYAFQNKTGRILLWIGYPSLIVASFVEFYILNGIPFFNTIPQVAPSLLFGYAYYLARERIMHSEIPAPVPSV